MKAYYEQDGITIYHADCRDVLPRFAPNSVDLVLTDPPYVGLTGGYDLSALENPRWLGKAVNPMLTVGNKWTAALDWVEMAKGVTRLGAIVFASYHFVPELAQAFQDWRRVALLTWHKCNAPPTGKNVPHFDTEFAWAFARQPGLEWDKITSTLIDLPQLTTGCMASAERIVVGPTKQAAHPTQKPLALMMRLLCVSPATVLDPFMGSGTTLIAAKNLGLRCAGIEIEERYCEIAANRLAQTIMPLEV